MSGADPIVGIVQTTYFGCCQQTEIGQTIDFGSCLLIGFVGTFDFGCCLITEIVRTTDFGCCQLNGIVQTDFGDWKVDGTTVCPHNSLHMPRKKSIVR